MKRELPKYSIETATKGLELALNELDNGRPAAAVNALRQALASDPNLASIHFHLGIALRELGRLDEARDAYREALRLDPDLQPARMGLADTLADLGQLPEAVSCYRAAVTAGTNVPAGISTKLGLALWKLGDSPGALEAFERSAAVTPGSAEAQYNLGSAQLELGRLEEAERSAQEALRLRSPAAFPEALTLRAAAVAARGDLEAGAELILPSNGPETPVARRYLALALRLMSSRLFAAARLCLERAEREDPGEVMACHLLAALSGRTPDHPVDGYVRQLFDASAATFDRDLVSKLGYEIPGEIVAALLSLKDTPQQPWDVLDLGCGTGLVGKQIAPYGRQLTGIDLAPNMIERARSRDIYQDLHCTDLLGGLADEESRGMSYDVVTAADVFIYVGKLDAVIPAIRRVMRAGGLFAFSVEGVEDKDYHLGLMGRYAHSADYLRRLAAANDFQVELLRGTRIRFEHRRPVQGWLTVWRRLL